MIESIFTGLSRAIEGGPAVARQDDPVAGADKDSLDQLPDVRIVVGRQDQCHHYPL